MEPLKLLLTPALWLLAILPATAQIQMTEICASNLTGLATGGDWSQDFDDWIEIHNFSSETVNLDGYHLTDDPSNLTKWAFPDDNIEAGEYYVIICNGPHEEAPPGFVYTNFKIRQTGGEEIILSDPDGNWISSFSFAEQGPTQRDQSWGKVSPLTSGWVIYDEPTPGEENDGDMYSGYMGLPSADYEAGYYPDPISVTLTGPEGASIYYTTTGEEPDELSYVYSEPILIDQTTVLKFRTMSNDVDTDHSWVETNTYFIDDDFHPLPVVAVSGDELGDGYWIGKELTVFELFNEDGERQAIARGESDEHGGDSNAYDQRGFDFVTRDQRGREHSIQSEIFGTSSRTEFQRLILRCASSDNVSFGYGGAHMRDVLVQTLAEDAGMDLDTRKSQPCVVYINGEYWGIYYMREKTGARDYYEYYYDVDIEDVDHIKTWGGTWNHEGDGLEDWNELVEDVEFEDLCGPQNLEEVAEKLNLQSLTDFYIINSLFVNTSLYNWEQSWWRAYNPSDGFLVKWRYALWDCDDVADGGINFTGVPETDVEASACQYETLDDPGGQGHVPLMNGIFENAEFESEFKEQYLAYLSGPLACDSIIATIDSLQQNIAEEMPRQLERWGGATLEEWEQKVQDLRDFFQVRCGVVEEDADECWSGESEGHVLTIIVEGQGSVNFEGNMISVADSPYETITCLDEIDLSAIDGFQEFVNWELTQGTAPIGDGTIPDISIAMDEDYTIIAYFETVENVSEWDQFELNLWPNPVVDHIRFESPELLNKIEIFDSQGRLVLSQNPQTSNGTIDLSNLSAGVYVFDIQSDKGRVVRQISIAR